VPPTPPPRATALSLPKDARLRRERDFTPVRRRGRRHVGLAVVVRSVENGLPRPRLGVSSPRRHGGAVARNRFRRLVRAAFRELQATLPARDWLVEPRGDVKAPTLVGILADFAAAAARR
jgi:ribonuclease P protein component